MKHRVGWWLKISQNGAYGYGEVAPLPGLSLEKVEAIPRHLDEISEHLISSEGCTSEEEVFSLSKELAEDFPSVRMGMEMALIDLKNQGSKIWFPSGFTDGKREIPINGLIWMGDFSTMKSRVDEKLDQGFDCIKLKVGAIDFEEELRLVKYLRQKAPDVTIRLDANGGFSNNEALIKLNRLADLDIHSIEQPIMMGQPEAMAFLCEKSRIPIALDEELVGKSQDVAKIDLLESIEPDYIVLKPTLLGGFRETKTWIDMAEYRDVGWWITSSLESNLGLNAISQFTAQFETSSYQGLGTGQLFHNNIQSKARIDGQRMTYHPNGLDEVGI